MMGFLPLKLILQKVDSASLDEGISSAHRSLLVAINTPPPRVLRSFRNMSKLLRRSSLFWCSSVSQVSVPMIMSHLVSSTRLANSALLLK